MDTELVNVMKQISKNQSQEIYKIGVCKYACSIEKFFPVLYMYEIFHNKTWGEKGIYNQKSNLWYRPSNTILLTWNYSVARWLRVLKSKASRLSSKCGCELTYHEILNKSFNLSCLNSMKLMFRRLNGNVCKILRTIPGTH